MKQRLHLRASAPRRRSTAGFTLVELLVAVAIGLFMVLAITMMMTRYESGRRSLTSVNDASQSGAYVTYMLDRLLRSAGSGYTQGWASAFGCQVAAARGGTTVLPRSTAFPAPFAGVPQSARLAPVMVHAGAGTDGSDVIAVTLGSAGVGESPLPVISGSATASLVRVPATLGLRANDLVLVYDGGEDCMVQQVTSPFTGGSSQLLDFAGTYAAGTVGTAVLANMYTSTSPSGNPAFLSPLGNVTGNRPVFHLVGVGPNATLVGLDMLQLDGTDDPVALADGVADLRARYGIDNNSDNIVDEWVSPAVAPYDAASLGAGTVARDALRRIIALRVAVLVRSSSPEREAVSPASLTLFADLPTAAQGTRNLSADEQLLRWRVLDFTVPLRNVLLAPA